jgi:hypothetical protein
MFMVKPVVAAPGDPEGSSPDECDFEEIVIATAEESAAFGSWAKITNVGDFQLEHLQARLRYVARGVYRSPLDKFLDAARLRNVALALLEGHQRPDQTRDLYLVASLACVIRRGSLLTWAAMTPRTPRRVPRGCVRSLPVTTGRGPGCRCPGDERLLTR